MTEVAVEDTHGDLPHDDTSSGWFIHVGAEVASGEVAPTKTTVKVVLEK